MEAASSRPVSRVAPATGYVALVRRNAHFRRLWLGNLISLLGDWFNTIALYTLVSELTGSPFALGGVFLTKLLPWALASPLAGLLVDRFNRRRLMIGADLVRAVIVLGFLLIDEPGEVYLVYVLTTLQVVVTAVFQPAKSASIPNIVRTDELLTANALMSATWSVMLALGAASGGLVTAWLGTAPVFVIDSLTYLVSAYFISRTVIPQQTAPAAGGLLRTAGRELLDGWRYLTTHPGVGRIALAKSAWALAGGGLVYMLALIGEAIEPTAQAAGIGWLFAARGLGTGIGPVLARAIFRDTRRWPAVLGWSIMFSGLCYGVVGVQDWTYAVAPAVLLAHAASGANWVLASVLLQQRTEDAFRGRVFATEWLGVLFSESCSILAASMLLEWQVLSLRAAVLAFALVQGLIGLAWLAVIVPRERRAYSGV